jgi:hypothetical protein
VETQTRLKGKLISRFLQRHHCYTTESKYYILIIRYNDHLLSCIYKSVIRKGSLSLFYIFTQVVVRVRPPLPRELSADVPFQNIIAIDEREQEITVSENLDSVIDENGNALANPGPFSTHRYMFDHVFDQVFRIFAFNSLSAIVDFVS